jgi:hypothetical protein
MASRSPARFYPFGHAGLPHLVAPFRFPPLGGWGGLSTLWRGARATQHRQTLCAAESLVGAEPRRRESASRA